MCLATRPTHLVEELALHREAKVHVADQAARVRLGARRLLVVARRLWRSHVADEEKAPRKNGRL